MSVLDALIVKVNYLVKTCLVIGESQHSLVFYIDHVLLKGVLLDFGISIGGV